MNEQDIGRLTNQLARWALGLFFGFIVLFGVVQMGLRWASSESFGNYTVILKSGQGMYSGALSMNWSGDFVIEQQNGASNVFTLDQIGSMSCLESTVPARPFWRLLIGLVSAIALGLITVMSILHATSHWIALQSKALPQRTPAVARGNGPPNGNSLPGQ